MVASIQVRGALRLRDVSRRQESVTFMSRRKISLHRSHPVWSYRYLRGQNSQILDCHNCGGVGHLSRDCATSVSKGTQVFQDFCKKMFDEVVWGAGGDFSKCVGRGFRGEMLKKDGSR